MLASPGQSVPTGPQWRHEVKWDGMRILADAGRLFSRAENDVTVSFPELHWLRGVDATFDGEVVALTDGRPSFARLAQRMHVANPRRAAALAGTVPVTYLIFDVLRVGEQSFLAEPWSLRREILDGLGLDVPSAQVPAAHGDGAALLRATESQDLEGVVSKRLDAPYRPGVRSADWLKFPHRRRLSLVVGGWRDQTDSPGWLGALLVGEPTPAGLTYLGRVGSGIGPRQAHLLRDVLADAPGNPFTDAVPAADQRGTHWVIPQTIVEVEHLGHTSQGRLRQPTFLGVRPDLGLSDLLR